LTLISLAPHMRYIKLLTGLLLSLPFLFSCDSTLNVNAPWQDITVVYGLLNQNDSVHYLKVTKAYLGEGDALMFAKIPDSSNYANKLEVRVEEWNMTLDGNGNVVDSQFVSAIPFDTLTMSNKEKGDSIFYYPYQLVYKSAGVNKLNPDHTYKLYIKNPSTGKEITSQTELVSKLADIEKPQPAPARASFHPGTKNQVIWRTVKGGKRYQFVARFHYLEVRKSDTSDKKSKYVDWVIFNDYKTDNTKGGEQVTQIYSSDAFYTVVGNGIHKNIAEENLSEDYTRAAYQMEYIFTIAADDMNTYMEVTEPSTTIVQEKPPFTNILNGIGLFSARYDNTKDYPIIQNQFSVQTLQELKVNPYTYDLGF
jgi:hypothetical protein